MSRELTLESFGTINLLDGLHPDFKSYALPDALAYHASGPWGIICLQEVETKNFLLRHFLFSLQKTISFCIQERNRNLQSLLSLSGAFEHRIKNLNPVTLKEKEYIIFNSQDEEICTTAHTGRPSSLINTHYNAGIYKEYLSLFNGFENDLKDHRSKPHYFVQPAKVARFSVHDSINALWLDRYVPTLQEKHMELRLETSLFSLLAQTYSPNKLQLTTTYERKIAQAARDIILRDIKVHLLPEQIATELHCSPVWLQRAFSKVFGIGMFHYLRRSRMTHARERLLNGESLKAVALDVGMEPSNFPKEFKAFFGYTVTELKKGQV